MAMTLIPSFITAGQLQVSPERPNYIQTFTRVTYTMPHTEILMHLFSILPLPAHPFQSPLLPQNPLKDGAHCPLNKIQAEL